MVYAKVVSGLGYLKSKQQSLVKYFQRFRPENMKLRSEKTYIIPTGFGISFAAISFVLLVMAIGYGNNLLYFFVFLLVSIAMTGMWYTNKNVDSFQAMRLMATAVFANEINQLTIEYNNKNKKSFLWSIELQFETDVKLEKKKKMIVIEEIQKHGKVEVEWRPQQRGLVNIPRLLIQSLFPYQMLKAWKYFDRNQSLIVYPERKGVDEIPTDKGFEEENANIFYEENQGLFRDYREFQRTDSPSRIDWKRSLKHQKHLVKNYENSGEKRILIDWSMTDFLENFEDRVSQMSLWVDRCHQSRDSYSLRIKDDQTDYLNTAVHYNSCMKKLALLTKAETI